MDKYELKRMIRAMNSCLNLYDTEIPEVIIDTIMSGIVLVANVLGLTEIADRDDDNIIERYVAPDNFEEFQNILEKRQKEWNTMKQ